MHETFFIMRIIIVTKVQYWYIWINIHVIYECVYHNVCGHNSNGNCERDNANRKLHIHSNVIKTVSEMAFGFRNKTIALCIWLNSYIFRSKRIFFGLTKDMYIAVGFKPNWNGGIMFLTNTYVQWILVGTEMALKSIPGYPVSHCAFLWNEIV